MNHLIANAQLMNTIIRKLDISTHELLTPAERECLRNVGKTLSDKLTEENIPGGQLLLQPRVGSYYTEHQYNYVESKEVKECLRALQLAVALGDREAISVSSLCDEEDKYVVSDEVEMLIDNVIAKDDDDRFGNLLKEYCMAGVNVAFIHGEAQVTLLLRTVIGNTFVVVYFDGFSTHEIMLNKKEREMLFPGESMLCINSNSLRKRPLRKKMLSAHIYEYMSQSIYQFMILSRNDGLSEGEIEAILAEERAERAKTSKPMVFDYTDGKTHTIQKLCKENSYGGNYFERNMPEYLTLHSLKRHYMAVECGVISLVGLDDKGVKGINAYLTVVALVCPDRLTTKELIIIPSYEKTVNEQSLTKFHIRISDNKLHEMQITGPTNVEVGILSQLRCVRENIDDEILDMVKVAMEKVRDKRVILSASDDPMKVLNAYDLYSDDEGVMIEIDITENEMALDRLISLTHSKVLGSGLYNGDINRKIDDLFNERTMDTTCLWKYGLDIRIRRRLTKKTIIIKGRHEMASDVHQCDAVAAYRRGMIVYYEDMLMLPCGYITTCDSGLLHRHPCCRNEEYW